ncbi:transcription antitermination factor NusB [Caviibacter abscessus]|uniref:transcription antitermination factor NusB n=1 Tax=Caviibacter abscessus TaxID=1766719 RepID=UPI00082E3108|nr:transcription antitermination factor NusB [Caviibacter abscessus]
MEQRTLRKEIFKILFERELIEVNIDERINQFLSSHSLSESKQEFFIKYIRKYIENEKIVIEKIKEKLNGWTFERLAIVEKVLLKMSFFEIIIEDTGHEIVINEAIEIAKVYGDLKSKDFINGILAGLVNN